MQGPMMKPACTYKMVSTSLIHGVRVWLWFWCEASGLVVGQHTRSTSFFNTA